MDKATEKKYWQAALNRLEMIDWDEPSRKERVEKIRATLPERKENESECAWLLRVRPNLKPGDSSENPSGLKDLTGLSSAPRGKTAKIIQFTPFTHIECLAAATEKYPLPDGVSMTDDESLEFRFEKQDESVVITARAQAFDVDRLANQTIGIAYDKVPDKVLVIIALDEDGRGETTVDDSDELRIALSIPLIGIVEQGDE